METENKTDERVEGIAGNGRELQGTAGNDGGNGKTVVDHIFKTLRENDDAKKELYKVIRAETGINVEPYLEGLLGERQDKKMKIEDIDIPLREMAENVLQMTNDGYGNSQIASFLGIYPSQVSRILKEREKWEKDITGAVRNQVLQNKKLPWYVRVAAKFRL
jgi:hypothetical protein